MYDTRDMTTKMDIGLGPNGELGLDGKVSVHIGCLCSLTLPLPTTPRAPSLAHWCRLAHTTRSAMVSV